jgi:hypothetical protein
MEMASGAAEWQRRLATKVQSGVNADKVVSIASVRAILEISAVRRLVLHAQEAIADTGIMSSNALVQADASLPCGRPRKDNGGTIAADAANHLAISNR